MNMVRCDGSASFLEESIDERVWSELGTRDSQITVN
jgi:hypothetical protein